MFKLLKDHWDWATGFGGMFATLTLNNAVGTVIGLATLGFILCRLGMSILRFRMTWKNRNNTSFFTKTKEEETET